MLKVMNWMIKRFFRLSRHKQPGYGVLFAAVVLSVMLLSTTLINSKISQLADVSYSRTRLDVNKAAGSAQAAWEAATSYFKAQLDAGNTLSVGSNTNGTLTTPTDPANLSGGTQAAATYTASIKAKRGDYYWMTLTTTVNGKSATIDKPFQYTMGCTAIESQILAGNISSLSDLTLRQYAQNNCMAKLASFTMRTRTVATGPNQSSGTQNFNATGTLDRGDVSGNATVNVSGSYTDIRFNQISSSNNLTISTTGNPLISLYGLDGSGQLVLSGMTGNPTFLLNKLAPSCGAPDIVFGSGTNTIYVEDGMGCWGFGSFWFDGGTGVANFFVNYLNGGRLRTGSQGDTIYSNTIDYYFNLQTGSGNDKFYTQKILGEIDLVQNPPILIDMGDGNDIIGCITPYCKQTTDAFMKESQINGGNGNDIIALRHGYLEGDGSLSSTFSKIFGGSGNNIIYFSGIAPVCTGCVVNAGTSGNSIVIIDGGAGTPDSYNVNTGTITASGSNNVLLIKSGVTNSATVSGFSRTITY